MPRNTAFERQEYAFSVGLYFGTDEEDHVGVCDVPSRTEWKNVL